MADLNSIHDHQVSETLTFRNESLSDFKTSRKVYIHKKNDLENKRGGRVIEGINSTPTYNTSTRSHNRLPNHSVDP
jgi:hypothetical protein